MRPGHEMESRDRALEAFRAQFGGGAEVVARAPGRVNLIGEHTDYNEGFVLPIAIERATWIAARTRSDQRIRVYSLEFSQAAEFDLADLQPEGQRWAEYVKGVAWALGASGYRLSGWDGVVLGEVPIGAGLSSSASVEMAVARVFAAVSELAWDPAAFARLAQRAENEWVGVRCGLMDQMASALGRQDHALLIDFHAEMWEWVPLPASTVVAILDTGTRRGLLDSAYNERRSQCEAAARQLGLRSLRSLSNEALGTLGDRLDETLLRRARHVVTENARTLEAAEAMRRGDAVQLGQLMLASHVSLRDDFEVSTQELDLMVSLACRQEGCFGARLTGAGFGGSAIALVEENVSAAFARHVAAQYQAATGRQASVILTRASDGASLT